MLLALLCFLPRLGATVRVGVGAVGCNVGFGGPGAIATTVLADFSGGKLELVGVGAAVPVPVEPAFEDGDSDSLFALAALAAAAEVNATEFFRLAAFFDLDVPTGAEFPLPRLRFLISSVFKLKGRTTPCSFKNKPHALQSGWPSGLRRQSGVVCV